MNRTVKIIQPPCARAGKHGRITQFWPIRRRKTLRKMFLPELKGKAWSAFALPLLPSSCLEHWKVQPPPCNHVTQTQGGRWACCGGTDQGDVKEPGLLVALLSQSNSLDPAHLPSPPQLNQCWLGFCYLQTNGFLTPYINLSSHFQVQRVCSLKRKAVNLVCYKFIQTCCNL